MQSLVDVIINKGVDDDDDDFKVKRCSSSSCPVVYQYCARFMVLSLILSTYFLPYVFVKIHICRMSYLLF